MAACLVGGLLLTGAGFLGWHATRGASVQEDTEREPDAFLAASHPDPEELRAEITEIEAHLDAMDGRDVLKRAVYQGMLDQARKNLLANPLAMSWKEFYRTSGAMQVDEETLIRNILARLVPEAELSPGQHREILRILHEERARAEAVFRERYARLIESDLMNKMSEEESGRMVGEIAAIRKEARAAFDPRYRKLLKEDQVRLVNLHLRNDFTCGCTTAGNLLGGIGVPKADLETLGNGR